MKIDFVLRDPAELAPTGITREQAMEQGRQIQRGMQLAMQRRYEPGQGDRKITRPKFGSIEIFPDVVLPTQVLAEGVERKDAAAKAYAAGVQNGTITHTQGPVSAMRFDFFINFYGFTMVDMVTGAKVERVMWLDFNTLEYATISDPVRIVGDEFEVDIHSVTAVRVDYVNKRVEVNTPAAQAAPWPFPTSQPKACHECCQPETCKRLDFCVAHRCRFGEDDAP